jgi:hypothetical protein
MSKFHNVAIKCDNFQQIEHLSGLARKEGLDVFGVGKGCGFYFQKSIQNEWYSNYLVSYLPITHFTKFIAEYEHPSINVEPEPTYTHDEYMRNVVHSMD